MVEDENAVGIGGVEKPSVMADELAAGHLKGALPDFRISAHALIENHRPGVVILLLIRHVSLQGAVSQAHRIEALQAEGFRTGGG